MPGFLDPQSRTFHLSVGALLWAVPQDPEPVPVPFNAFTRAALGREAHRNERDLLDPAARAEETRFEQKVSGEVRIGEPEYRVVIEGRADQLRRLRGGGCEVREVKSLLLPRQRFLQLRAERYPNYVRQAQIYAWLLAQGKAGSPVSAALLLVNLADGERRILPLALPWAEIDQFVMLHARYLLAQELARRKWLQARTAQQEAAGRWPFPALRHGQEACVSEIRRALEERVPLVLEAPAGMGKTACALAAALPAALASGTQVAFLTAKGTQQAHVLQTLDRLRGAGAALRSLQLRNKEGICINGTFACLPSACRFLDSYGDRWAAARLDPARLEPPLDLRPELFLELGRALTVCPSEAARQAIAHVDVLVADYNYFFDPAVRLRELQPDDALGNWIVIVDEAHNLVERACDAYSIRVDLDSDGRMDDTLRRFAPHLRDALRGPMQRLRELFAGLPPQGAPQPEGRIPVDFAPLDLAEVLRPLDTLLLEYFLHRLDTGAFATPDPLDLFRRELDRFQQLLLNPIVAADPSPIAQCLVSSAQGPCAAELRCLDPGPLLAPLWRCFAGVIAMSATLSPFEFYRTRLGLPANARTGRFPSPFAAEQRPVWIIPSVPTTYPHRARSAPQVAEIVALACHRTGVANIAAFFPSFAYLEAVRTHLPDSLRRQLLIQTPGLGPAQREHVLAELRDPGRGRLLLAVLGGVFAEGIDYRGTMLEGVIVISPGLPAVSAERETLARYYTLQGLDGFAMAYAIPGMQRVLQAVGRLIRAETEHGFVLLVGERFVRSPYRDLLPAEWHGGDPRALVREDWPQRLAAFAQDHFTAVPH